jgi:hypothetical protein
MYVKNDFMQNHRCLISEIHKVVKSTLNKAIMKLTWTLNSRAYLSRKFGGIQREAPKWHTQSES